MAEKILKHPDASLLKGLHFGERDYIMVTGGSCYYTKICGLQARLFLYLLSCERELTAKDVESFLTRDKFNYIVTRLKMKRIKIIEGSKDGKFKTYKLAGSYKLLEARFG